MFKKFYTDLASVDEVKDLVAQVCSLEGDKGLVVTDEAKLQNEVIATLQFNASVNEDDSVKMESIKWINAIADAYGLINGSNFEYYQEKSEGKFQFSSVPAINSRMLTFHTVRAAVRAARNQSLPHIIFEMAISEGGYTGQPQHEYAALVRAAYISLGIKNQSIYIQGDHYQLDPKKFADDPGKEKQRVKNEISKALENGMYNIDLDCSKFETMDADKSDKENQAQNASLTAEMLMYIRQYEKDHPLPQTISVGGEVGEVGGENTRYPQVNAYLELIKEHLENNGMEGEKGLSKVSINVGSAHGGVLGSDGKPLDSVPLDFSAHHDLYMMGNDPLNPGMHVVTVQHGASTLPKHYFPLFPAMHVAEVHLATGFQNVTWDVLEKEDSDLYNKMKTLTEEMFADKIASHDTEAIGFMKERKRVTEFVKRDLFFSKALDKVEEALEEECNTLINSLHNLLLPKGGYVEKGDRED